MFKYQMNFPMKKLCLLWSSSEYAEQLMISYIYKMKDNIMIVVILGDRTENISNETLAIYSAIFLNLSLMQNLGFLATHYMIIVLFLSISNKIQRGILR